MRSDRIALPLTLLLACALPVAAAQTAPAQPSSPAQSSSAVRKPASAASPAAASHSVAHPGVKHRRRQPRGQMAPTPERIAEIQTALAKANAYQGDPTSHWDAATIEAMKRFQTAQGLPPTGKIDALTLQRLGLGSDVAGKGAPTPLQTPDLPLAQSSSDQSSSASIESDTQLH